MERAVIVRGQLTDKRHIELDEPLEEIAGPVEVTVRPLERASEEGTTDVKALLLAAEEWRAAHPELLRSKEEIDRYIAEERASWSDREE